MGARRRRRPRLLPWTYDSRRSLRAHPVPALVAACLRQSSPPQHATPEAAGGNEPVQWFGDRRGFGVIPPGCRSNVRARGGVQPWGPPDQGVRAIGRLRPQDAIESVTTLAAGRAPSGRNVEISTAPYTEVVLAPRRWFARPPSLRSRALLAVGLTLVAAAALVWVLASRRGQFSTAVLTAPVWLLLIAALLQLVSLVTRSEAWNFCMRAAGSGTSRRVVFRAAGMGALAGVLSAQLGVATRIGALRRTAPHTSPRIPTLMAAEVPIVVVEATLAALFTFTLIGPLGLPAWAPLPVIVAMGAVVLGLRRLACSRQSGFWGGLAAARQLRGRGRLVALVVVGVLAQIARNLLVLHAVGVNTSVFNAIAVLIVSVSLSPLPFGAGVGATATVLILGSHGVAETAAAGVLLTVTGTVAALCYAVRATPIAWSLQAHTA